MKSLLVIVLASFFLFVVTPGIAQDVSTLKVNDRQLARLINVCINKTESIYKYCHDERFKQYKCSYILKIISEQNNDSIKISITPSTLKYLLWPSSIVYGYYNKGGYPIFVIKDNIEINDKRIFQKDPCFINEMVDSLLSWPNDSPPAAEVSQAVYVFTFHQDLLKNKSGVIAYGVYYPVTLLNKKYWPVEFRDYLPYYTYSFEYEQSRAPWDWCPRPNFDGTFQTLTPEELDKMKHGSFHIDLRKRSQKIE